MVQVKQSSRVDSSLRSVCFGIATVRSVNKCYASVVIVPLLFSRRLRVAQRHRRRKDECDKEVPGIFSWSELPDFDPFGVEDGIAEMFLGCIIDIIIHYRSRQSESHLYRSSLLKEGKIKYNQTAFKFGRIEPVALAAGLAGSYSIATSPARSNCEPSKEQTDNLKMWNDRWSTGKTRWHRTSVNRSLEEKISNSTLKLPTKNARVLVPLCGKTVDMAYLAGLDQVKQVVGVDGSQALDESAAEHPDLLVKAVAPSRNFKFEQLKGPSILLLKGDFFDLDATEACSDSARAPLSLCGHYGKRCEKGRSDIAFDVCSSRRRHYQSPSLFSERSASQRPL